MLTHLTRRHKIQGMNKQGRKRKVSKEKFHERRQIFIFPSTWCKENYICRISFIVRVFILLNKVVLYILSYLYCSDKKRKNAKKDKQENKKAKKQDTKQPTREQDSENEEIEKNAKTDITDSVELQKKIPKEKKEVKRYISSSDEEYDDKEEQKKKVASKRIKV